ncbi:hypothetical protein L484_021148 [Morus notabilis]|uniref:Uncharacterized protein n=1 Tax=Morus notabilis TaxID=981085 RepID=W9QY84_9ROSA|nr:hypothetical protein L484_021148 [Morus notabilis]
MYSRLKLQSGRWLYKQDRKLAILLAMELTAFIVEYLFDSLQWIDVMRGFGARLRATFRELDAFNNRLI